jgi:hypothetical protein
MFISFPEFHNGNCSPVVELMPTVDPAGYTDQRSRRIAEVQPAQMIILPPISTIPLHHRFMDLRGHTSTMGSKGYWETTGGNFRLRSSGRFDR